MFSEDNEVFYPWVLKWINFYEREIFPKDANLYSYTGIIPDE